MKYILYARKSTEDEDRQVLSIEAQIFELKEFAAKEKLEIVSGAAPAVSVSSEQFRGLILPESAHFPVYHLS